MSTRQDAIAAVTAAPGCTLREVAAALGLTTRAEYTSLSAQMSQLCRAGKLRKDSVLNGGSPGSLRYWPMPSTTIARIDIRKQPKPPAPAPAAKPAPMRSAAEKRGSYTSRHANVPKPSMHVRIIAPPRPKAAAHPAGKHETVEEFRARGGRIETVPSHASSHPLRYDHSNTKTPVTKRRPTAAR